MPPPDARHPELLAYRSEFPLLDASVYLNTCSLGARSERSRRRLEAFLADWDELGARAWYRRWLDQNVYYELLLTRDNRSRQYTKLIARTQ